MCAESALLGELLVLVPEDHPVGAGLHQLLLAARLVRVDHHDPVAAPVDRPAPGGLHARRLRALLAGRGDVMNADAGRVELTLDLVDAYPEVAEGGLRFGEPGVFVSDVLVLAGDLAVVAADTPIQIGHHA